MVHRDCVVERGSSRMCEYGTRGCGVVHMQQAAEEQAAVAANPQDRIKELEKINAYAAEQLLSLANEQRHRKHGCRYPVIEPEDLDEVVDVLTGKTSI